MRTRTCYLAVVAAVLCLVLLTGCPKKEETTTIESKPIESTSKSGNVIVTEPRPDTEITSPVTLKGRARVFEAAMNARVVSEDDKELGKTFFMTSEGAPAFGTFDAKMSFTKPVGVDKGFVEVFTHSAKDGSVIDLVRIPVKFK